jgi:histidinol-phosphatase
MTPKLSELLSIATEAAYVAGRRTLAYFNTPIDIDLKSDETPVTIADRESEHLIRAHIAKYFPTHSVLGEEHGSIEGDADYKWIIDPIDGTKTFVQGVPLYGVMIGVEVRRVASVGVIYLPAVDEMVCAALGEGCWWNGRRARVSKTSELSKTALMTSDMRMAMERSSAFAALSSKARLVRTWGDCFGYVLVATGRADVMVDPKLSPWDCAPLPPILSEAGGKFTSWKGEATHNVTDGFATNGLLHDQVLNVIKQHEE